MRRAAKLLIGVAIAVSVVTFVWFVAPNFHSDDESGPGTGATPTTGRISTTRPPAGTSAATAAATATAPGAPAQIPTRPADAFEMVLTYTYDGDTVQARMVSPNQVVTTDRPIRIRLVGVNTPERDKKQCWAEQARDHLMQILPTGSRFWAAPDRDSWDDYGRRLFNLWTADGRFVEYELVAAGDGEAIRVWPNVTHYQFLAETQSSAQQRGVGMWDACR